MLARFERLLEDAVEGSLRRVFPASLQPVQLAKAAARAMEQSQVIGVRGAEVANQYVLRVAPPDLERLDSYSRALKQEVAMYLARYARDRRLRPVAGLQVNMIGDSRVRAGSVRVEARFVNLAPRLLLTDKSTLNVELDPQAGVVRVGRADDNDVVLESERVSRYHAELRWIGSRWLAFDLESTNGTWLDERRVPAGEGLVLDSGARLRLGDYELAVRVDEAGRGPG
jgi:hypothetical protein